jgi:hypothetical protein
MNHVSSLHHLPRVEQGWFALGIASTCSRRMTGVTLLLIAATALASCAEVSHTVADLVPHWAGGLPKNTPPRPGTPEYDAWVQQQQAEAARDKSQDPPKPKTEGE